MVYGPLYTIFHQMVLLDDTILHYECDIDTGFDGIQCKYNKVPVLLVEGNSQLSFCFFLVLFFDFMNFWIFWYPIFWYSHYISGCSWYILFHILVAMLVFLGASFFDILFVFLDFPDTFFFYSLFYFLDFHANCFIYQILYDFPDYLRSDM